MSDERRLTGMRPQPAHRNVSYTSFTFSKSGIPSMPNSVNTVARSPPRQRRTESTYVQVGAMAFVAR